MHDLAEIKKTAHALEGWRIKKLDELRNLQSKCHHPRTKEERGNTVCAVCGDLIFFGTRILSEEGLIKLGEQCAKTQDELDELYAQLVELRKHCPHPEDSVIHSENSWCGICLDNWWDIQKRKSTTVVTA